MRAGVRDVHTHTLTNEAVIQVCPGTHRSTGRADPSEQAGARHPEEPEPGATMVIHPGRRQADSQRSRAAQKQEGWVCPGWGRGRVWETLPDLMEVVESRPGLWGSSGLRLGTGCGKGPVRPSGQPRAPCPLLSPAQSSDYSSPCTRPRVT